MSVTEVRPDRDRARRVLKSALLGIRRMREVQGDDLAGYALVHWDARGECGSTLLAGGMVGEALVPSYVGAALNRHVAVLIAERTGSTTLPGDDA